MKTLLLFLALAVSTGMAQDRLLVKFYTDNMPYSGLTNYPQLALRTNSITIPAGWNTNWTVQEYEAYVESRTPLYLLARSNVQYTARASLSTNVVRLLQLYEAIPAARSALRSFADGTNTLTTAQLTVATRQLADYTEKLMEFIQRVGPVLRDIYKPENDPINPVNLPP